MPQSGVVSRGPGVSVLPMDINEVWFVFKPMKTFTDFVEQSSDGRTQPRSNMFLAAVLRTGAEQFAVKVRNLSPNGALVESSQTPSPGIQIELIRGDLRARGTVMWNSPTRCGLQFSSEVSVKDWLAAPTKLHQRRVDEMVALVKSGAISEPAGLPASPRTIREPRSDEKLVDDLASVVRLMHDLEEDLASSDETLTRHALKLQNLDLAMQTLRAIAEELVGDTNPNFNSARLDDLRVACAQALGD